VDEPARSCRTSGGTATQAQHVDVDIDVNVDVVGKKRKWKAYRMETACLPRPPPSQPSNPAPPAVPSLPCRHADIFRCMETLLFISRSLIPLFVRSSDSTPPMSFKQSLAQSKSNSHHPKPQKRHHAATPTPSSSTCPEVSIFHV
jgi:hypothetical protein